MLQFDYRHYVPILKSKRGEAWALAKLSATASRSITPLIDFLPQGKSNSPSHIQDTCKVFHEAILQQPVFIDTALLGIQTAAQASETAAVFACARKRGMHAIPVTSLERSQHFQMAIRDIIRADGRGVVLRLLAGNFADVAELRTAIDNLMSFFGISPDQAHVLLDYRQGGTADVMPQFLRLHIPQLLHLKRWATLTAAGGCFPSSLPSFLTKKLEWVLIPREEWRGWRSALIGKPSLPRNPTFADYGVRDPGVPTASGRPSANLRYTTNGDVLVCRGDPVKDGGAQQIPAMCKELMKRPEFAGAKFSEGDAEIVRTATTRNSGGGPQQWLEWGMNHHLESVAQEVARVP